MLNGQAKNYIWRVLLLAAVLIETIRFVYQLLVENMSTPTKTLYQKKGKGIFKREFWYIPLKGEGAINRRITHAKTVDGSKPYRSFQDITLPGRIRMNLRSCHKCEGCMNMDHTSCQNRWLQVNKAGKVDHGGYVQLYAQSGAKAPVTRGYLKKLAVEIYDSDACTENAFVVFEVEGRETEAWGIGKVSDKCIRVTEDGDTDHMRIGNPGDILLEVEKFEPVAAGSSTFEWASKTELINAESLRFVLTTEPGQKRCRCVDQIACAHTAREAAAFPLVVPPARLTRQAGRRIASSEKRVLSAAAKTEIMGLIATIDVNAEHDMDIDTGDGSGAGGAGAGAGSGGGGGVSSAGS